MSYLNLPPLPEVLTHDQAAHWCDSARAVLQKIAPDAGATVLQLDAGALSQFDSSALAALLVLRREAAALGHTLLVQQLPSRARELAALYGVSELLAS